MSYDVMTELLPLKRALKLTVRSRRYRQNEKHLTFSKDTHHSEDSWDRVHIAVRSMDDFFVAVSRSLHVCTCVSNGRSEGKKQPSHELLGA